MGNIRQLAPGEVAPSGLPDVHGVAHRLKPSDVAKLTDMEHEYRWQAQLLCTMSAPSATINLYISSHEQHQSLQGL